MLATEARSCHSPPFLLYGKFLLGLHSPVVEQVSESFYVTVQKWADERKHLKLGCFLRYMNEAPGQEHVLFLLRLFRNLEGLSIDRWKWWVGQSMIKWVCVLSPYSLTPCRSCNNNKGTILSRHLQFCYRELHIGTLEEI